MKKLLVALCVLILLLSGARFAANSMVRESLYPAPVGLQLVVPGDATLLETPSAMRIARGLLFGDGPRLAIILHGNGAIVQSDVLPRSYYLAAGFTVLMPEYPGYGVSGEFMVSETNIYDDVAAMIRMVQDTRGFTPENTVIFGTSLGGGVAVEMAHRGLGNKLVVLSSFTSVDDMIAKDMPKFLAVLLNTEKFNSLEKAQSIKIPTLVIHGDQDDLIPFWMAEAMHAVFPNSQLLKFDSDRHSGLHAEVPHGLWQRIVSF